MADNNKIFSDYLLDRKGLKTKLNFWRNLCLIIIAFFALNFLSKYTAKNNPTDEYIASVSIKGAIDENKKRDEVLRKLAKNQKAKAVILFIDSPGGTLYPAENTYSLIKKISAKKPVIAIVEGYAASAAYMVALGSERIFARDSSVVGSVGAWIMVPDVTELTEKIGIKMTMLKSGPLKAQPQPFDQMTPEVKKNTQSYIDDAYNLFVNILNKERKLPSGAMKEISTGATFLGQKALKLGLIDEIGAIDEVRDYLYNKHKINQKTSIKEFTTKKYRSKLDEILGVLREAKGSLYKLKNYLSLSLGL